MNNFLFALLDYDYKYTYNFTHLVYTLKVLLSLTQFPIQTNSNSSPPPIIQISLFSFRFYSLEKITFLFSPPKPPQSQPLAPKPFHPFFNFKQNFAFIICENETFSKTPLKKSFVGAFCLWLLVMWNRRKKGLVLTAQWDFLVAK